MVAWAKQQHRAKFKRANFYDLPFKNASFDGFWAAASLLHAPKRKISVALKEIRRVIKPGGVGFVSVKQGIGEVMLPLDKTSPEKNLRFFSLWTKAELKKELMASGFKVLKMGEKTSKLDSDRSFLIYYLKKY